MPKKRALTISMNSVVSLISGVSSARFQALAASSTLIALMIAVSSMHAVHMDTQEKHTALNQLRVNISVTIEVRKVRHWKGLRRFTKLPCTL